MGKTKVFELAKKLGLENKEMIERLHKAGIDAKSHQSVLEENDLKKFEAAAQIDKKVDEERLSGGIIRRRRKETVPEVVAAPAVDLPAVTIAASAETTAVAPPPSAGAADRAVAVEATPRIDVSPQTQRRPNALFGHPRRRVFQQPATSAASKLRHRVS
jgi:translation initiation factor IF-2